MVHIAPHGLAPPIFARFSAVVRSELQNFGAIPVLARNFSARATGLLAMANVTKRNFEDAYEQLKGHLQKADFVAIDLEMTGVESTMWRRNLEMDTCETRYQNLKHSAEKFAVLSNGTRLVKSSLHSLTIFLSFPGTNCSWTCRPELSSLRQLP
jgi:hypothetical protein